MDIWYDARSLQQGFLALKFFLSFKTQDLNVLIPCHEFEFCSIRSMETRDIERERARGDEKYNKSHIYFIYCFKMVLYIKLPL